MATEPTIRNIGQVAELARDLAAPPSFQDWAVDLASPGLLEMLQKKLVTEAHAAAPLRFAPPEGPHFFEPYGWQPVEVYSLFKTAAQKGRIGFPMRLLALLPESKGRAKASVPGAACAGCAADRDAARQDLGYAMAP